MILIEGNNGGVTLLMVATKGNKQKYGLHFS
jgi:hypothetical protein